MFQMCLNPDQAKAVISGREEQARAFCLFSLSSLQPLYFPLEVTHLAKKIRNPEEPLNKNTVLETILQI